MFQECPEPSSQGASYVLSCSKHNSSIFWSWISLFFLTLSLNKSQFMMFFTLRNGHFLSLSNTRLFYETRFVYARTFRNPISTLSFKIWNFITRFEVVSFKMGITLLVWIPFCLKNPYPNTPTRKRSQPVRSYGWQIFLSFVWKNVFRVGNGRIKLGD